MLYLLTHLVGLVSLVGIFYLTGWLADQRWMRGRGLEPYSLPGRFGLGAAVWMGLVFIFAALGVLRPATLTISMVVVAFVAIWFARRHLAGRLQRVAMGVDRRNVEVWGTAGLALVLGALLLLLWLQALWPQISWDAAVYHLTVPRLYLEHRGFYRIPFNVYSNWPLNAQLLFGLALGVGDHVLAKQIHFVFGLACLLLIWRSLKTVSRPWAGWLGACLFLLNPVVLDEMRAAYVDLVFAFFLLLSFLFLHEALDAELGRSRKLMLAGVFAGVMAGIKPTGFGAVLCLAIVLAGASWTRRQPAGALARDLGRLLLPAGLLLAPWVVKSWLLTGNPVYPFLFRVFGGSEWSLELGRQLQAWQLGIGMGREWSDYLLLPYRVIVEGGPGYDHFDGRVSLVWLLLIPLSVLMSRRQPLIRRSLLLAGLYFVFWALSSQQTRFLIPVLPLLALAATLSVFELCRRAPGFLGRGLRWSTILLGLIGLLSVGFGLAASTRVMLEQYLELGRDVRNQAVHPVYRFIGEQSPVDARLLFLNTNHGYFCPRDFIADSFFEASQINDLLLSDRSVEGIGRLLSRLGITHLLIENRDRGIPWPESLYEYLNDASRVRPLYRSPDGVYDVVEVIAAAAAGGS